jgi:hypothetical protein
VCLLVRRWTSDPSAPLDLRVPCSSSRLIT